MASDEHFLHRGSINGYGTTKIVKGEKVPASPSDQINILYWLDKPTNTKQPLLHRWWEKLSIERRQAGSLHQAIIFQRTGKRPTIMISWDLFNQIHTYCNGYFGLTITISGFNSKDKKEPGWEEFTFLDLEGFLNWVSPATILLMTEVGEKEIY